MKKIVLLLLSFSVFSVAYSTDEKKVKTTIDDVIVYLNGALVHHKGTVSLPAGNSVIIVHNVSPLVYKKSIRAQLGNGVKVLATDYNIDKITSGMQDSLRLKKIADTTSIVNKENRRLRVLISSLESERKVILDNSSIGSTANNLPVAEVQKLADFYRVRLTDINLQLFKHNETLNDNQVLLQNYDAETKRIRSVVKTETFHQIKITVNAKGPVTTSLDLRYVTGGAAWAPKYDIRAEGVDAGIVINYNAHVMNQSGEEWKDVKIVLSTADPIQSHNTPKLVPWFVSYNNTQQRDINNNQPRRVSNAEAQQQYGEVKVLKGIEYDEIELSNIAVDFPIDGTYSIPSDSKPYLLEVANYSLSANFQYFCAPKADKDAFLRAQITGWEKLNLVQGETSIYFRGMYIGQSYINPGSASDTLSISMGRDNKVAVNRVKIEEKESIKIIGSNKSETFTYKITVRNTNQTTIKLELEDQIPVSQTSEVEVNIITISGADLDKLSGLLKWNLELKANESKEFIVSFTVKYPKNKPVQVQQTDKQNQSKKRAAARFL